MNATQCPTAFGSRFSLSLALLAAAGGAIAARADGLTTADLLRRLTDVQRLVTPPAAGESTTTVSGRGKGEYRFAGPGVITRIATPAAAGSLKITADGKSVFDGAFAGLFDGSRMPFVTPISYGVGSAAGGSCYCPIAFQTECVVTIADCPAAFVIDSATLPVPPVTFTAAFDDPAKAAVQELEGTLRTGLTDKQLFSSGKRLPIAVEGRFNPAKKERSIREEIDGAGTIRAMYVALTDRGNPRVLYALHACILRMYWDGAEAPAVEAPLCDFFGSGFDLLSAGALPIGTDRLLELPLPDRRRGEDTFLYCHFPMPFSNGVVIEIENLGTAKFGMMLYIEVDRTEPPADSLRFHARYRRTAEWSDAFSIGKLDGPGRIVGWLLNVDCATTAAWDSAKLTLRRDDAKAAAPLAEDLGSFFGLTVPPRPAGGALHGATRGGEYGKSSLYRWLLTDSIPFQKSCQLMLTPPADKPPPETYVGSLLYWYAAGGAKHDFKPLDAKVWAPPGLRIPGAVEIEGKVQGADWGSEAKQKNAGPVEFSNELAARIATADPVTIALNSERAGRVMLKLRVHPRRAFETIDVSGVDGALIGTVKYDTKSGGVYDVGEVDLAAGENLLTVKCSKPAILDCWIVEAKR